MDPKGLVLQDLDLKDLVLRDLETILDLLDPKGLVLLDLVLLDRDLLDRDLLDRDLKDRDLRDLEKILDLMDRVLLIPREAATGDLGEEKEHQRIKRSQTNKK